MNTNWQPIATAPKDATHILVYDGDGFMFVALWSGKIWQSVACAEGYFGSTDCTHWMPLPAPPEDANG